MIPKLYDLFSNSALSGAPPFLGRLTHCLSCLVTEERNGEYTLTLQTTVNEELASYLVSGRIIGANPNPHDNMQYFIIYKTERTMEGRITVYATHIKGLLNTVISEGDQGSADDIVVKSGKPDDLWDLLNDEYIHYNPFSFSTDITASKNVSLGFTVPETLANILSGKEGSFTDVFGGELKYDNLYIRLLSSRGTVTNYKLRYGGNVSDSTQTESSDTRFSHILAYGRVSNGSKEVNLFTAPLQIDNDPPYHKTYLLECSEFLHNYTVGSQGQHYTEVRNAMAEYATTFAKYNDLDKTRVSVNVTVESQLDEMKNLALCDTVKVELDKFGMTVNSKITKTVYDVLLERWDSLTVGDRTVTLGDLIINKRRYISGN